MYDKTNAEEKRMFELAFNRPRNYFQLSEETQWDIDRQLGILDWGPYKMDEEETKRWKAHFKK